MVHSEDQTVSSGPFVGEDLGVNSSRTNKDQKGTSRSHLINAQKSDYELMILVLYNCALSEDKLSKMVVRQNIGCQ